MQKVLYIPQEKWEPDIHHHRKADDLGARLKITKGAALCHGVEPRVRPPTAQGWFNLTMPVYSYRHFRSDAFDLWEENARKLVA